MLAPASKHRIKRFPSLLSAFQLPLTVQMLPTVQILPTRKMAFVPDTCKSSVNLTEICGWSVSWFPPQPLCK